MYFSCAPDTLGLYVGDEVDVLFNIDINEWAGHRSVQIIVRDIKQSDSMRDFVKNEQERFAEVWNGAEFSNEEHIIPSREDFAVVYRMLASAVRIGECTLKIRDILYRLRNAKEKNDISYIKLLIIIKVMQELNIMGIEELGDESYTFSVQYRSSKAELDKSTLLRRLRSQQNN